MSVVRWPALWLVSSFGLTASTAWALQSPAGVVEWTAPVAVSSPNRQGAHLLSVAPPARAGTGGDSDGDGIDDATDVDDDNDTLSDDQEGIDDTDDDGVADCLDLDSDNDGIPDLVEAVADRSLLSRLDNDRDGQLDASVVIGGNGLADAVETAPDSGQSITGFNDLDADSRFDQQDLDADNDGLPDVIEAGASDADYNGVLDRFRDIDGDGLSDQLALFPIAIRDTDDDGIFDFRDLDSDQDGLTDLFEWLGQDTDGDGRMDQFTDADANGLNDDYGPGSPPVASADPQAAPVTIGQEGGGVGGCMVNAGDGRDPLLTLLAVLAVFALWGRRRIRGALLVSAVVGAGCASPSASSFGGVVRDAQVRQVYAGAGFGISQFDIDTEGTGIEVDDDQAMLAQLTAGGRQGPYAIEVRFADLGEVSFVGTDDTLGLQAADLSGLVSWRGNVVEPFVRLGAGALFDSGDVETDVRNEFHAVLGGGLNVPVGERWSMRAEVFTHDVDVTVAGLSVLYHFGGRAEVEPAPAVTVPGARAQPHELRRESRRASDSTTRSSEPSFAQQQRETAAESVPKTAASGTSTPETAVPGAFAPETVAPGTSVPETTGVGPLVAANEAPGTVEEGNRLDDRSAEQRDTDEPRTDDSGTTPAPSDSDQDADGVTDSQDDCPGTRANTRVDTQGCLIFGGTVVGITFADLSDQLDPASETVLQQVLGVLQEDDSRRLTVTSHVFEFDDADANLLLSRRRTLSVIRWLTERGITASRIRPEAFGSTRPLADGEAESDGSSRLELFLR